jgi:hypothetical protein
VQRPQLGFIKSRAFDQILSTVPRRPCRVSRMLKRQNNSREVISTNLAHTAQCCRIATSKTMAERYHKRPFRNSTLVLPPLSALWPTKNGEEEAAAAGRTCSQGSYPTDSLRLAFAQSQRMSQEAIPRIRGADLYFAARLSVGSVILAIFVSGGFPPHKDCMGTSSFRCSFGSGSGANWLFRLFSLAVEIVWRLGSFYAHR